jgi:hypothetical protein
MKPPWSRHRLLAALLATGLVAACAPPAAAHPFSRDFYSMRSGVRLDDGQIQAVVVIEIPTPKIMMEFVRKYGYKSDYSKGEMDEFTEYQFDRLGPMLHLTVEGREVEGTWEPVDDPRNGKGGEGFFLVMVAFSPAEPVELPARVEVGVTNEAFEGEPMYYSGYAEAGQGWVLLHCSAEDFVGNLDSSVDFQTELDAWTDNPELRTVTARFERRPENRSQADRNR